MFKVYVIVRDDEGETRKHELDGKLYKDTKTAYKKIKKSIKDDLIEDYFDITEYIIEEV